MPVWAELVAMMLLAYAAGIAIGWGLWGRSETEKDKE